MSKHFIINGLQAGDESKGATVDALTRQVNSPLTVKFTGGAQCAHNVVNGTKHHTFAQFGAGTFAGAKTHLGPNFMVGPKALFKEAEHLVSLGYNNILNNITIDENCLIITPYHVIANRLVEEARGKDRHGSCGCGIGACKEDSLLDENLAIRAKDLFSFSAVTSKLNAICSKIENKFGVNIEDAIFCDTVNFYKNFTKAVKIVPSSYLTEQLAKTNKVIFEGAQGVLLDEVWGFAPYHTWSDTTFKHALSLLDGCGKEIVKIGCIRAFTTRHGPGPLPTEFGCFQSKELHNDINKWQGAFRWGLLDFVLLRYALEIVNEVDYLSVSHLDLVSKSEKWNYCDAYLTEDCDFMNGQIDASPYDYPYDGRDEWEKFTKKLMAVTPHIKGVDASKVLDIIKEETKIRIGIRAYGPEWSTRYINLDL